MSVDYAYSDTTGQFQEAELEFDAYKTTYKAPVNIQPLIYIIYPLFFHSSVYTVVVNF